MSPGSTHTNPETVPEASVAETLALADGEAVVMTSMQGPSHQELVEIGNGIKVRRSFVYGEPIKVEDSPSGIGRWSIRVEIDDNAEATVVAYEIVMPRPLKLDELNKPDLAGLARYALMREAENIKRDELAVEAGGFVILSRDEVTSIAHSVREGMTRRNQRITHEHLAAVMSLYRAGGIGRVRVEMGASERTVRRWLAAARENGIG